MNELPKSQANHAPLTPLSFLRRARTVFPDHLAVIHGSIRITWREQAIRSAALAHAIQKLGVREGDTVAFLCPNTPAMVDAHFGVPLSGAVLNALNYRLDAAAIAFTLDHSSCRVLFVDSEFHATARAALKMVKHVPIVVDIIDPEGVKLGVPQTRIGSFEYDELLRNAHPRPDVLDASFQFPLDEWDAISLNYTSGTTGNPKGVVTSHRGAYLNSVANIISWGGMPQHPVYLWTLPMFHCNGWCFPWTLAALGGTNVCLRRTESSTIYDAIVNHGVTHLCGAPIVMQMIIDPPPSQVPHYPQTVRMMTAAAPPPPSVLARMRDRGFEVTHVYGLTETYGPATVCAPQVSWESLSDESKAAMLARQGVGNLMLEELEVVDPDTLEPVPRNGKVMGEIVMRGNIVMKGYLNNPQATREAFVNDRWFRTGDVAVIHPDNYIQIKDRSKDVIISGGENISSIEVEQAIYKHADVMFTAVVAKQDEKWGEVPCAFVELRAEAEGQVSAKDILTHCRKHLAGFKMPKQVVFCELPKTSTGKIRKNVLRDMANSLDTKLPSKL